MNILEFLKNNLLYIIVLIIAILVKVLVVSPIRVNGSSMNDTLFDKDIMILDKISYKFSSIKRFDIVVLKNHDEYLIKRVIGLPDDYIEYKDNKLYINGKYVKEEFKRKKQDDLVFKVPKDKYYVLGDNRNNSLDSRYFGAIKKDELLGKTSLVIYPFKRFGGKK